MEFLVRMQINLPADMDLQRQAALREAEEARSGELLESGAIFRIWRVPGRAANVGVWRARDATELHDLIQSLPLFPWFDVDVTALAQHPTEAAAADGGP